MIITTNYYKKDWIELAKGIGIIILVFGLPFGLYVDFFFVPTINAYINYLDWFSKDVQTDNAFLKNYTEYAFELINQKEFPGDYQATKELQAIIFIAIGLIVAIPIAAVWFTLSILQMLLDLASWVIKKLNIGEKLPDLMIFFKNKHKLVIGRSKWKTTNRRNAPRWKYKREKNDNNSNVLDN